MRYSLRTKLSLSYVFVIVVCVLIVIVVSNALLETQFRSYVTAQQQREAQKNVSLISERYKETGSWDIPYIGNIGMNALESGMIIRVVDTDGAVVWDATTHNNGLCQQMLSNMNRNMQSRYMQWEGGYQEAEYDLNVVDQKIGTVSVGYYGPFYYTDSDLYFINTINSLIIWAGVASIVLALGLGIIMSGQLSRPISRVIDKAQMIAQGFYGSKISERSNTKEIRRLVDTVNNLAETLQKQEIQSKQTSMDIAHELRTPLTTMQGNLEAVMDGVMEMNEDRMKVLHEQIIRLNRLVDDLAELARFESQSFTLEKTRFDLSVLIDNTINHFYNDFAKDNKSLTYRGNSLFVFADRDKLSQVLINLLSNALKFTKPGDSLEVYLNESKNGAEIGIKDTGVGISDEDLPHIFERFYRSDKSRSRKTGGAGIGLTIAKSIIIAHGGSIKVNSKLNEGTEIIIFLPKEIGLA
jgi:signal transduction histidine kinase